LPRYTFSDEKHGVEEKEKKEMRILTAQVAEEVNSEI